MKATGVSKIKVQDWQFIFVYIKPNKTRDTACDADTTKKT